MKGEVSSPSYLITVSRGKVSLFSDIWH